ncbi:MAG: PH domain-containing protein [Acidimicrobiia bacterium]
MLLWYTAGAIVITWTVLRDPAVDHRMVALGALLPLAADLPAGRQAVGHSLLAAAVVLAGVMAATIGHRRLRRRLLFLPFGMLCGLVLSGAWLNAEIFAWPVLGTATPDVPLLPPLPVLLAEEALGLAGWLWIWNNFGLRDRKRRRFFLRNGRLDAVGQLS